MTAVIGNLQREVADVTGVTLYLQPVQDLTIDTIVSRSQYQFVLEDANSDELATWTPKLVDALNQSASLANVVSDQS